MNKKKSHLSRTKDATQELPNPFEGNITEGKLRRLDLLKVLPSSKTTTMGLGFQVGDEPHPDQRRIAIERSLATFSEL